MTDLSLDACKDTAQQMVTACLHKDRATAVRLAQEFPDPMPLALVLADLVAFTHHKWAKALDMTIEERNAAWAVMMADVAAWRLSREGEAS